jgi:DNA polymerase-3 subunit beta
MKIKIQREPLLHGFQTVAAVAPLRSPKEILRNVKLDAREGTVTLSATDTELGIRMNVNAISVEAAGAVVLPVARFSAILRESTHDELELESDGETTYVACGRSKFRLQAENPDEFPEVPRFEQTAYHEISARLVKELIRRTLFATDLESSRYALAGVLLVFDTNSVMAVGTDGRRLAKMEGPAQAVNGYQTQGHNTIVPYKTMQLIERSLADADAEIKLAAGFNEIVLQSPRVTIHSRLVEGRYPRWQDILQSRAEASQIELVVGPFFSAVRQAAIVSSDESRGLDFTFGEGTLTLRGQTADVGSSTVEIPISYQGANIELSLDHRFVADFLRVLDLQKTVTLSVIDDEHPAEFRTDDGYIYVLMPMSREMRKKNY